ncbi:inner centromere protein A-like isoform X2 [Scyliorhinus canicula]|uniref:inner centromere protein A-like isoform X2 n=1 Tax=Scyliorhinus canicula TaxID=7830 RepID=UPI0018F51947|nr:inner centromere protein A-like isoform X2 [Scyliorhinus canicula]
MQARSELCCDIMASRTAIIMVDTDNLLQYLSGKLNNVLDHFKENTVWLEEIQEEAKKMFISDFNAEPELMPKTPSERKRRRRRPSAAQDFSKRLSRNRRNLRRSSIQRTKIRSRAVEEDDAGCNKIIEQAHPVRLTRSTARAIAEANLETEKNRESPIIPVNGRVPLVVLSLNDCRKSVELHKKGQAVNLTKTPLTSSEEMKLAQKEFETKPLNGSILETLTPATAVTAKSPNRAATKVKIAEAVAAKENRVDSEYCLVGQELNNILGSLALGENCISEDESQATHRMVHRSVHKSSASRRSSCLRLVDKYALNVQRTAMVREAVKKSLRKSSAKKKNALESSASSYQNCTDKVEEIERECVEDVLSTLLKSEQRKEEEQPVTLVPVKQERRCTRSAMKIATDSLEEAADDVQTCRSSGIQRKDSSGSDKPTFADDQYTGRKRSYKCAVANVSNCSEVLEKDVSPPRKKSPSPPSVTASKVVRPKHKSFLHAVQKNQLLMTPVSVGRTVVKSFIKRNTPLKVDPKEQEKARLANLKKKREQEEERIQKVEEEKKRKLEEFKKKREMQVRRVLETRSRVEQQEAEKKKKIAQKFAQIDEKNAKMREERFAEEKAKKQLAAKRMEEAEARRRQEEEIRNKRLQQLEEERRELQQRKKEEELERQRKMAEARKFQEQRQAELERERLRELQLAADRERERKQEQENIQAEKERERLEKERALQLQRELERTAREDAALQAQREKERLHKEAEEKERKQEEQRLAELEKLRLEKEKTRKEQEGQEYERQASQRIREAEERKWKEEQDRKAEKETTNKNVLNVTVEVHNSPTSESYAMTPNSYSKIKLPKVNLDNYGMDLNSDDSTDDEGAPRKQIPAWANGKQLQQALIKQYYHPLDVDHFFGIIQPPDLKTIFGKIKPRYLKRTSSAVWHSPPVSNSMRNLPYGF